MKDLVGNTIKIGDSVVVQDADRLSIGKVHHFSNAGSVIIHCVGTQGIKNTWKRIIGADYRFKILVLNIPIKI